MVMGLFFAAQLELMGPNGPCTVGRLGQASPCCVDGLLINLFIEIIADCICAHLLHNDWIIPAKVDDIIE
jgi:hypothetical protein